MYLIVAQELGYPAFDLFLDSQKQLALLIQKLSTSHEYIAAHGKEIPRPKFPNRPIKPRPIERALNRQHILALDQLIDGSPGRGLLILRDPKSAGWKMEDRVDLVDDQREESAGELVVLARVAEDVVVLAVPV